MTNNTVPNMPSTHPVFGVFTEFQNDPLDLLERSRAFGDVVRMRFFNRSNYVMHHPDAVQQVLVKNADKFQKDPFISGALEPFIGNGLVRSEGEHWKRQRKMMQPAFHTQRIRHYADTMVERTQALMQDWQHNPERDIQADMVHLTSGIIGLTLFGHNASDQSERISKLLLEFNQLTLQRAQQINLPRWMPTAHNRAINELVSAFDSIIMQFIEERRKEMIDHGDLLSMLLLSEDENGQRMSAQEVRDEAATLFLAGNDTTAVSLTWTLYLLSQHPDIVEKIRAEVDSVATGRALSFEDLRAMPYVDAVIKESQRLYPSAWAFSRECIADTEIMGYHIPKNSVVTLSPWVMHHDETLWDEAHAFKPERFLEENDLPKYAYYPFGGGQRVCIGNNFAMMEMRLILATIVRQMQVDYINAEAPHPDPLLVLQPDKRVNIKARILENTLEPTF